MCCTSFGSSYLIYFLNNFLIVRGLLGCLSVLLRSQETESWKMSSTIRYLDSILLFTIDRRPKVRKAAQHAICSILATKEDSQQVRAFTGLEIIFKPFYIY